jgi:hypothetical protein
MTAARDGDRKHTEKAKKIRKPQKLPPKIITTRPKKKKLLVRSSPLCMPCFSLTDGVDSRRVRGSLHAVLEGLLPPLSRILSGRSRDSLVTASESLITAFTEPMLPLSRIVSCSMNIHARNNPGGPNTSTIERINPYARSARARSRLYGNTSPADTAAVA